MCKNIEELKIVVFSLGQYFKSQPPWIFTEQPVCKNKFWEWSKLERNLNIVIRFNVKLQIVHEKLYSYRSLLLLLCD